MLACKICICYYVADRSLWPVHTMSVITSILKSRNLKKYIYNGLWVVNKVWHTFVQNCLDSKKKQNMYNYYYLNASVTDNFFFSF